jgi:hypothetical protein
VLGRAETPCGEGRRYVRAGNRPNTALPRMLHGSSPRISLCSSLTHSGGVCRSHMRKPASTKGPPPYRAVFVPHVNAVLTSGAGSNELSLYSTTSGQTISRTNVGFDPTTLHFSESLCPASLVLAEYGGGGDYKGRLRTYTPIWGNK